GETPMFEAAKASQATSMQRGSLTKALQVLGLASAWSVEFYIFLAYLPSFAQKQLGVSSSEALWSNTAGIIAYTLVLPLTGYLSDRIGRRPVLAAGCLAFALLSYPLFSLLLAGVPLVVLIGIQVVFGIALAAISGPATAALIEIFPTRVRSGWL